MGGDAVATCAGVGQYGGAATGRAAQRETRGKRE
jgi:hypothetical protein